MRTTKYPRTPHLTWSNYKRTNNFVTEDQSFLNNRVIVTDKVDGVNVTLDSQRIVYKSLSPSQHPCKNWMTNYWNIIQHKIPHNIRVSGINCFAKVNVHYTSLPSYFIAFAAWDNTTCLSWDESVEIFNTLNMSHVKVLYDGSFDKYIMKELSKSVKMGYVLRNADEFNLIDFNKNIGKYVHIPNNVDLSEWIKMPVTPNILGEITI